MSEMWAMPRSVGIVRAWVRLYTQGLPADLWSRPMSRPQIPLHQ
jgi:hypothetical protein